MSHKCKSVRIPALYDISCRQIVLCTTVNAPLNIRSSLGLTAVSGDLSSQSFEDCLRLYHQGSEI